MQGVYSWFTRTFLSSAPAAAAAAAATAPSSVTATYDYSEIDFLKLLNEAHKALGLTPFCSDERLHEPSDQEKTLEQLVQRIQRKAESSALAPADLRELQDSLQSLLFDSLSSPFLVMVKRDLWPLKALFEIIDKQIPLLEDATVCRELKLQLANLPAPLPRSNYPNLRLSEQEALGILTEKLAEKVARATRALLRNLEEKCRGSKQPLSETETKMLTKLLSSNSSLGDIDRKLLRECLLEAEGCANAGLVEQLYRISKVHQFFMQQSESDIFIPQSYHATNLPSALSILKDSQIKVMHKKANNGAWVSLQPETCLGEVIFAFNSHLSSLDPLPHRNSSVWRGLQVPIPLAGTKRIFGLMSLSKKSENYKEQKKTLRQELSDRGYLHIRVVSDKKICAIYEEVISTLGVPNLPDGWWSANPLFYSQHQIDLQEMAKELASRHASSFPTYSQDWQTISQVVQQLALPLYKIPTPLYPSYPYRPHTPRIALPQNYAHGGIVEDVANKVRPAREIHGTLHGASVALFSLLFMRLYEKFGRSLEINPLLLALSAALHDVAREDDIGPDHWDEESSEIVRVLLQALGVPEEMARKYVHAVREKDPAHFKFTNDAQEILHDTDAAMVMRTIGELAFDPSHLSIFDKIPSEQKPFFKAFLSETYVFIQLTEKMKNRFEHHSHDVVRELVDIILQNLTTFPTLITLL